MREKSLLDFIRSNFFKTTISIGFWISIIIATMVIFPPNAFSIPLVIIEIALLIGYILYLMD